MKRSFARDAARARALFRSGGTREAGTIRSRLISAWKRAFLNYTPAAPGHWRDPENEYGGNLEHPSHAVPFLSLLLASPGGPDRFRDEIQAYCEFFAAVWRTVFSASALRRMVPLLRKTSALWPETPGFRDLLVAVERELTSRVASADPHRRRRYPSEG